ncbi:hypothetical protein GCM10022403_058280 [Streptomyces coacervatus]|uniref:Uncharacterized protein n=1 Tax=Streptomyces coacervatus TaxID=647381 RepID=A0ABP7IFQ7_9ACTN
MRSRLAAGAAGAVGAVAATAALLDDVVGIIRRAAHDRRNPECGSHPGVMGNAVTMSDPVRAVTLPFI